MPTTLQQTFQLGLRRQCGGKNKKVKSTKAKRDQNASVADAEQMRVGAVSCSMVDTYPNHHPDAPRMFWIQARAPLRAPCLEPVAICLPWWLDREVGWLRVGAAEMVHTAVVESMGLDA